MNQVSVKKGWGRFLPALGLATAPPMDSRTLYALALLLALVQLPHLVHLPLWVSASGAFLVGARLLLIKQPTQRFLKVFLSPVIITCFAAGTAFIIKWDFGYFVGRDPAVAFLFILVAAKYAEIRHASDATLLLCLAAFLLLTQYFYSQSVLSALVTLPAVVALAYSLAVLRDPENPDTPREQLRLIAILLLQGVPLAALLFVVFPRLPGPLWSLPEDSMATTGLSDSMSPGSIGQLSQSSAVAFRVEFEDAIPPVNERYWRGPVLTEFDGQRWEVSPVLYEAAMRYTGSAEHLLDYTVTLQPHRQRWLFALDLAVGSPQINEASNRQHTGNQSALARVFSDGQIIANERVSKVLRYQQQSLLEDSYAPPRHPTPSTLRLPGKNLRTIDFARKLRAISSSDQDYARRVMRYFNEKPYFYTLAPQLLGDAPVDEFMFDTRSGFCEHYAAAFVVLMRAANIPSRVVTGYLGGEMNDEYMIVRQSDAHAWAEAYIDGKWQRFDPTGAVAPSRVEQGLAAALPDESAVPRLARLDAGWLRDVQLKMDAFNHHWQRLVIDYNNSSQEKLWEKLGLAKPQLWQITLLVLFITGLWSLMVLGFPGLTGFASGKLTPQEHQWQRLSRLLHKRGLARHNHESPSEYLSRASSTWPQHAARFARLNDSFNYLRFRQPDQSVHADQHKLAKDILWLTLTLRSG